MSRRRLVAVECPHPGCEYAQYHKVGADLVATLRPHFRLTHEVELTPELWEQLQLNRIAEALTPPMLRRRT